MDSTIFTGGGPDLKFKNDTGHWILIEGIVDDAKAMVTFNIYGTKVPGRTVERIGPAISNETPAPKQAVYIDDPQQPIGTKKQTDTARGGLDVEIWRVIKQDGVEVRRTRFLTQFQPWPNIFVKNPQTPLPPGAKLGNS
jgi:vancomycin resistance protein YoaR